jgi:hypothetical protein
MPHLPKSSHKLGFEHFRDGVFVLDLTTNEPDRSLAHLRTQVGYPSA